MFSAISYAVAVSFLAVLCSPLWKKIYKDSGLKRRLLSHILFVPVYVAVGIFLLDDGSLYINETDLPVSLSLFNGLLFYTAIFFIYEFVLSKVERAVTVKVLLRIYQNLKAYEKASIDKIINEEEELLIRVDGLLREKFIKIHNNRYQVTKKGARSAKILSCIRRTFWTR